LDELDLWDRALSPAELQAIYAAGSLGKYSTNSLHPNFQVTVDGISTNTVILTNFFTGANDGWQEYTNSFVATNSSVTIELAGQTLSTLFDDIQLVQLPLTNYDNYYLPEEPLTPLIGQNPNGCWTLDIWDTRTDSSLTNNGVLLSWTLQATISSTNVNLTVLTNGVPNTNTVAGDSITYFAVDVPETANFATNILSNAGGPLNLLFNQMALPTGSTPGDFTLLNDVTKGTNTLASQGAPPQLAPGQRYFLGVQNNSAAAVAFDLEVQFDVGANTNIITLTNQQAYQTNISTNGAQFYTITVPTNASMVTFQLLNPANAELDLFAREGLPVPGPLSFDYQSRNAGTNDQFIVVTTNSQPVALPVTTTNDVLPLRPTTWYLSVYNFTGATNAAYTIIATYVTNGPTTSLTVIPLSDGIFYSNSAAPGYPANILYSFTVTNDPAGLEFAVTNLAGSGNVELLAAEGMFPTPEDFYTGSFNPGIAVQLVEIGTNAAMTNFNGLWYLAVPNTGSNSVSYSITATTLATLASVTPQPEFLGASIASPAGGFTMYWSAVPGQTYEIDVSTDLLTWTFVTDVTPESTEGTYTDSVPVNTQTTRFFRLVTP